LRTLDDVEYGVPNPIGARLNMEDAMSRARRRFASILGVTALLGAMIGVATPASSGAGVTCTYNDTVGLVTVEIDAGASATVNRDGDFVEANNQRCLDGVTEATVTGTEVINIVGGAGSQRAEVSLTSGRFEPGRTDESGSSDEIEIFVNLGGGSDSLKLSGRNQIDMIVVGRDNDQTRLNLNAGEGDTVDYDLSVHDNVEGLSIFGNGGGDAISATGGFGTGTVLPRSIHVSGGGGNDSLTGGGGKDVLTDRAGTGDVDVLVGKGGNDALFTRDGDARDRAVGGPGVDDCRVDRKDVARAC
jgi:hypothetical protein